ncbi:MAG: hypothetical protein PHT98_01765 [Kiritimatiellae bacterium]|jgi:hypothetical protein|nr:hypothetical protein [Kiritimatiellia bacterium]MDD4440765.1 hypothetical protein [Kiritimatiellia bacterium]
MKCGINSKSNVTGLKKADVSRRHFAGGIAKMVGLGVFAHFKLLGGDGLATTLPSPETCDPVAGITDDCPGGVDAEDVCSFLDPDKCPGENPPQDYCPSNGDRNEDVCNSGLKTADVCNEAEKLDSDQCESGTTADDVCDANSPRDNCPNGQKSMDYCPPNGTIAQGDKCFGGGHMTNGEEQDECDTGKVADGDDCPPRTIPWLIGTGDENDCHEVNGESQDECTLTDDDTCINGQNHPEGAGGDDFCDTSPNDGPGQSTGSDQCIDGTPEQDVCNGQGQVEQDGLGDSCPGGSSAVDTCEAGVPNDDDYCPGGTDAFDECPDGSPEKDDCPGGGRTEDKCPNGLPPEDECPGGGCSGGDQESWNPDSDACTVFPLDSTPPAE